MCVEPDAPSHLLDQVDLTLEVGTERRDRRHQTCRRRHRRPSMSMPSGAERVPHLFGVEGGAEHVVHPARAHADALPFDRRGIHVFTRRVRRARRRPATSSSIARSALRATASGSMPRSKRALDSLRSLRRFDVLRDPHALEVGRFEQDLRRWCRRPRTVDPPMIPAMACGTRSASQIRRSSAVSSRSTPSSVVDALAVVRHADDDAAAAEPDEVERVQRLVAFEQHVVGDVDHVADRPHARFHEPLRHPRGRLPHRDPRHPTEVARDSDRAPRSPP